MTALVPVALRTPSTYILGPVPVTLSILTKDQSPEVTAVLEVVVLSTFPVSIRLIDGRRFNNLTSQIKLPLVSSYLTMS